MIVIAVDEFGELHGAGRVLLIYYWCHDLGSTSKEEKSKLFPADGVVRVVLNGLTHEIAVMSLVDRSLAYPSMLHRPFHAMNA